MFNLYSLVVLRTLFVPFDDAKLRRFLVSFQTFSLFFYQKLWTKNPFMDKSGKTRRFLSIKGSQQVRIYHSGDTCAHKVSAPL